MALRTDLFEPAWNYHDDYVPYNQRPPAPVMPRHYPDEKAAERALEKVLSPYFELHRQVKIVEKGHPPQFIDYVAVMPEGATLKLVGIEVKSGFREVKGACEAIRQAMRYRKARLRDGRLELAKFLDDPIPYVFLWPQFDWATGGDWYERHPNPDLVRARYLGKCEGEARALRLFAAHWNVGHVEFTPWWHAGEREWRNGVVLMNGQQTVWTSRYIDAIEHGFRGGAALASKPERGMRYLD